MQTENKVMKYSLDFKCFDTNTLLINWPNEINGPINHDVVSFNQLIVEKYNSTIIVETVPSYCSLTLYLKGNVDSKKLIEDLTELYKTSFNNKTTSRTWELPVCYDLSFGLDLQQLADSKSLSVDEVIQLHSQPRYHVYLLGFLPGFPYLGGLDSILSTPRLTSPRIQIPKGSVAIGDQQTGVYPSSSPGGWNIIGRTPIELFDVNRASPTFIQAGDKVKFNSINLDEFNKLTEQINKQSFNFEELKSD